MTVSWDDLTPTQRELAIPIRAAVKCGESVLLKGSPGSGKTMIARRLTLDLGPLLSSRSHIYSIYRLAGLPVPQQRPFRAPHRTCSTVGLIGSGQRMQPGECSLAHTGVLFLDELPEFPRACLDVVAIACRDKKVTYGGKPGTLHLVSLPTDFILVGAVNPCPCGRAMTYESSCQCSTDAIARYHDRYSMLEFDHEVLVHPVATADFIR